MNLIGYVREGRSSETLEQQIHVVFQSWSAIRFYTHWCVIRTRNPTPGRGYGPYQGSPPGTGQSWRAPCYSTPCKAAEKCHVPCVVCSNFLNYPPTAIAYCSSPLQNHFLQPIDSITAVAFTTRVRRSETLLSWLQRQDMQMQAQQVNWRSRYSAVLSLQH